MNARRLGRSFMELLVVVAVLAIAVTCFLWISKPGRDRSRETAAPRERPVTAPSLAAPKGEYSERWQIDVSGFGAITSLVPQWRPDVSLQELSNIWRGVAIREIEKMDRELAQRDRDTNSGIKLSLQKALMLNSEGRAEESYKLLEEVRSVIESEPELALAAKASVTYLQGVTALRWGENDNCVLCLGECSCILPIAPSAVHTDPRGSRAAIKHFTEYLSLFHNDLEVRWLLNLAHMTLGEYPDSVDPRYRLDLNRFFHSEFDIGKFRDVSHLVGVDRFNVAGGGIMDDFDNDGLLDIAVTAWEPTQTMAFYHNNGDATFNDRSEKTKLTEQLGGQVCYQTDFNNDGRLDIYVPRGAWMPHPIRPSLLRNDGSSGFTDVTKESGLADPANSHAAAWADYDNDGWLDLFMGCERQVNRLYHNKRDGTFEEVGAAAHLQADAARYCKGCAWIDYDNDDYPDLFVNNLGGLGRLYHNNRDGTFADVSTTRGIDGPAIGFSCWAWDYDNDGWLDIFATSYDRTPADLVKGLIGEPHHCRPNRLFRNLDGLGFENVTDEVGLNMVFATMGSNFGDFDNDGWLDMYLATGDPNYATLVPNRMFKNIGGRRFSEITGSSGTGHLQKGHSVACGDWDRDGDIDLFVQTGGASKGDAYHNLLFQNPGQGNRWLTLKLVGKKTNRVAIGARIKVVTSGAEPLTIYRHVTSGSSFGANPLEQTIGLAKAERVARLEIHWPTSGTTQVFHDIAPNQAIEITEFAESYRPLDWKPLPAPHE
jgi:hypothetical protein